MIYSINTIFLIIFIIVNIVLRLFSIEGATFIEGADSSQYINPAINIINHGSFSGSNDSLFTIGTPLYSMLLLIPIKIFGFNSALSVIVLIQCVLLFTTGMLSRLILCQIFESRKGGYLIQGLVIFNPNSLITAHLIQSETLFTLFLTIMLFYSFCLIKNPSVRNSIFVGIFCGLLALIRPAGLYFALIMPIFIFAAYMAQSSKSEIKKYVKFSFLTAITSILIMTPWYARNYIETDKFFLSSNSGYYLRDQYIQLLKIGRGWNEKESIDYIDNKTRDYYERNKIDPSCLTKLRHWSCNDALSRAIVGGIINEPFRYHAHALLESWSYLYFSGGASNFRNYLGISGKNKIVSFQKDKHDGFNGIISLIRSIDYPYLYILLLTTSFSVITRIYGAIGVYYLIKNRNYWPYLIILLGIVMLSMGMYLYLGQSRFRVPIEPILMFFTVAGLLGKKGVKYSAPTN
ncbi:ArnT family glycosyltransferase [Candidatus Thioglobus autotrophicus]|uniref:ArnT family glycosyltransferase n=1 Tax=Candidatus Thioglobus autotrophicus TaxID=1705394 RepID=UPI00299E1D97|nr:glycosyltransferase family 39 protein [Candidatus Thioglobus autotrophicus]WPE17683.1 glycosyltransferase family 39 protein [Candidatus Thioglobus autotrophicus]